MSAKITSFAISGCPLSTSFGETVFVLVVIYSSMQVCCSNFAAIINSDSH